MIVFSKQKILTSFELVYFKVLSAFFLSRNFKPMTCILTYYYLFSHSEFNIPLLVYLYLFYPHHRALTYHSHNKWPSLCNAVCVPPPSTDCLQLVRLLVPSFACNLGVFLSQLLPAVCAYPCLSFCLQFARILVSSFVCSVRVSLFHLLSALCAYPCKAFPAFVCSLRVSFF